MTSTAQRHFPDYLRKDLEAQVRTRVKQYFMDQSLDEVRQAWLIAKADMSKHAEHVAQCPTCGMGIFYIATLEEIMKEKEKA